MFSKSISSTTNGDLNGIFTWLKNNDALETEVESFIYPQYQSYKASFCFDRNISTICHASNSDITKYLLVHFFHAKMKITGYTIQNRNSAHHGLKKWDLKGSNDNKSFTLIESRDENFCAPGSYKTFNVESTEYYSFIKIDKTEGSCSNPELFDIAEVEFFGDLQVKSICTCNHPLLKFQFLHFFIIYYSILTLMSTL